MREIMAIRARKIIIIIIIIIPSGRRARGGGWPSDLHGNGPGPTPLFVHPPGSAVSRSIVSGAGGDVQAESLTFSKRER